MAKVNFRYLNSTNQNLFSSKNDDEDLVIISELFVGVGLNLWRGDSRGDFFDLQLGIGPRYEYDYIDFEEKRNQIDPALAIILLGRGFTLGEAKLNRLWSINLKHSLFNYFRGFLLRKMCPNQLKLAQN